jgi:hypothetical protein
MLATGAAAVLPPAIRRRGPARAYPLKFTAPGQPGAAYSLLYDLSTKDPPDVCRNLVDYKQKFGELPPATRVRCRVPRG